MPPPVITPLPTPPTRTNPANFSERADHFLSALPNFGNQINTLADYMNTASVGSIAAAENARDLALQYRDESRSARDIALQHRNDAQTARTGAETAQGLAETAQGLAETAQGLAETAATLANGMPLGTITHFAADTPPSGWLVCDGTAVTAMYPELRQFLLDAGSPYGLFGADPLLPDLRGEFVRGWDGGRGVDAGRVFGSAQGDALQDHGHINTSSRIGAGAGTGEFLGANDAPATQTRTDRILNSNALPGKTLNVADETRPRNIALLPCIRAYASVVNVPGQADLDNILQQTQAIVDAGVVEMVSYLPKNFLFTASGTWVKPEGIAPDRLVKIEVWAGGGGGSGSSSSASAGAGGGGGGYAFREVRFSEIPAEVPVTVGAGGSGAAAGTHKGSDGGTSSFGSILSASGGIGGNLISSATTGGAGGGVGGGAASTNVGSPATILTGGGSGGGGSGNAGGVGLGGGGGGGSGNSSAAGGAGGVSALAGNGGSGGNEAAKQGGSGAIPSGGGGGSRGNVTPGGNGARGEVRITIL